MADTQVKTALILSAYDRMSRVVNEAVHKSIKSIHQFRDNADKISKQGLNLQNVGAAFIGSEIIRRPIQAFAELEDGAARLQSVMMMANGSVSDEFEKVSKLATSLGNTLPGTTSEFYNMFAEMVRGGMKAQDIISGTGKAASYLAVQLKLPFEEVGLGVAKLREAAGVADQDMMAFMDTIQRTANVGVKFDEMQIAFARSAGQLKFLGLQGLEASKDVAALYAMLIKSGATGETVGTGISAAMSAIFDEKKMALANAEAAKLGIRFKFLDEKGNFMGITNMIGQFGRLKGFSQQQISRVLTPLLGPTGQDVQFIKTLASGGLPALAEMQKRMQEQADLEARVNRLLSTWSAVWESLTGTFTNLTAVIGGSIAPQLKSLGSWLNTLTGKLMDFMERNEQLSKVIGWVVTIIGGLALTVGALGLALGTVAKVASISSTGFLFFAKAVRWASTGIVQMLVSVKAWAIWGKIAAAAQWLFNASLYGCPVIWIVMGIAAIIGAVILLVAYWKPITAFFGRVWEGIKAVFNSFWGFIKKWGAVVLIPIMPFIALPMLIIKNWDKVKGFFSSLLKFIGGIVSLFYNAGKNIVKSIWEGIKAMASKPIEAIKAIIQKIRNFLPFSPAKEGPFRDLHRVKIIETIAATMKPAPMIRAMSGAMGAVASGPRASFAARGASGGLTYAPVININGGASARDKEDFRRILRENADYLYRMMQQKQQRNESLSY